MYFFNDDHLLALVSMCWHGAETSIYATSLKVHREKPVPSCPWRAVAVVVSSISFMCPLQETDGLVLAQSLQELTVAKGY